MSLSLTKVLSMPNSTLVGAGRNAVVITRQQTDGALQKVEQSDSENSAKRAEKPSPDEKKVIAEMRQTDNEVRQHEQKHMKAAGSLAKGPAQYEYRIGPDGRPYAVGGHVSIDTSMFVNGNEDKNRQKAGQIQDAALAPGDPSVTDLKTAMSSAHHSKGLSSDEYSLNKNDVQMNPNQSQPEKSVYALPTIYA